MDDGRRGGLAIADWQLRGEAAGVLGSEPLDVVDLDAHIIINADQLGDVVRDARGLMAAGAEEKKELFHWIRT